MNTQIYNYLKKYYLKFIVNKFQQLNNRKFENNKEINHYFQSIWKKEHGGLFLLANPFGDFVPPENLPYKKDNVIFVTDTGSNSLKFKKKIY